MNDVSALPATAPETLEGWYALHQVYTIDRRALDSLSDVDVRHAHRRVESTHDGPLQQGIGWSACVTLIGSSADLLVMHFRPTLDEIGQAQRAFVRHPMAEALRPVY